MKASQFLLIYVGSFKRNLGNKFVKQHQYVDNHSKTNYESDTLEKESYR